MKKLRIGDYFYIWSSEDGKTLSVTQMDGDNPIVELKLFLCDDLEIAPYFYNKKSEKIFDVSINTTCVLFDQLKQLTIEKVKTSFSSENAETFYNPTIVNDFNSKDNVKISNKDNEIIFSFNFSSTSYLDMSIGIKNFLYDGRSDIDRRRSDYKIRFANVVNNSFSKLDELYKEQNNGKCL